jgi:gamma-glutamylcyclotransferase (GGCT)/AIG2-like uncharacterized protein YtfP
MSKYLFVYGTLMSSFDNPMAKKLQSEATFIGPARVKGSLYDMGSYPALVLDTKEKVYGELYELNEESSWEWLDLYEEVPVLYVRREIKIKCNDQKYLGYVYEYAGHVYQYSRIESGDFRKTSQEVKVNV